MERQRIEKARQDKAEAQQKQDKPAGRPENRLLELQRSAGNQAVLKLMGSGALQPVSTGKRGDAHEQEADRAAEAAMKGKSPMPLSPPTGASPSPDVPAVAQEVLNEPGRPLDEKDRAMMEKRFDRDFSGVRVHDDARAAGSARDMSAQAYTSGKDIVFGAGTYEPGTARGMQLLAHELAHVAQQASMPASAGPVIQMQNEPPANQPPANQPPASQPEAPKTPAEMADDYEADAMMYFVQNMEMELRTAASVEGAAIGRHAAATAANMVNETCEPYEASQELDTNILNTVFAVGFGGTTLTRGFAGGGRLGQPLPTGAGINIGSRILGIGMNVLNSWIPTLAGYGTVGALKGAAVMRLSEAAQEGGETNSDAYLEYESDVMARLRGDWQDEVNLVMAAMSTDPHPEVVASIGRALWPARRAEYLNKLRSDYGSRGDNAQMMEASIRSQLRPRLDQLKESLDEAKRHRKRVQASEALLGSIGGFALAGAAIGAAPTLGLGAGPGALIGAGVGLVVGGASALYILFSD